MTKVQPPPSALRNRLLARLPDAEYRRILSHLKPVRLALHTVLYESRGTIDYVYFPIGSVLSALTIMQDGTAIEVATTGNEGLSGHSVTAGSMISPNKVIVQIGDGGWRIEAKALQEEDARGGALHDLLIGYHAAFMCQVSQSVACNGLHRLEQRCCRWLLMTRDRTNTDDLRLTHEYLSFMLGARRASITDMLKPLQEAGEVRSQRGKISILDRAGLEARTCECYWVVKDEYDRLLGEAVDT